MATDMKADLRDCLNCGARNTGTANACRNCGRELVTPQSSTTEDGDRTRTRPTMSPQPTNENMPEQVTDGNNALTISTSAGRAIFVLCLLSAVFFLLARFLNRRNEG